MTERKKNFESNYIFNLEIDFNLLKEKKVIGIFDINNWQELNEKYGFYKSNVFDFMSEFLNEFHLNKIDELNGAYSFICLIGKRIYILRDRIGIFSIVYEVEENPNLNNQFFENLLISFDKKNFAKLSNLTELKPTEILEFDLNKKQINFIEREFPIKLKKELFNNLELAKTRIKELLKKSILKQIPKNEEVALLFSGGTDSLLLSQILTEFNYKFTCYTTNIIYGNIKEGEDLFYSKTICKKYNLKHRIVNIDEKEFIQSIKETSEIISDLNYTKISVGVVFYSAFKNIVNDGFKYVISGIGSEEIFADYKREFENVDINEICLEGLKNLWERDLYREFCLSEYFNLNLKFPFLDLDFIQFAININPELKINKTKNENKIILRKIIEDYGLEEIFVNRKKKAAQYGSRSDRIIEKLSKKLKLKKQEYIDSLSDKDL